MESLLSRDSGPKKGVGWGVIPGGGFLTQTSGSAYGAPGGVGEVGEPQSVAQVEDGGERQAVEVAGLWVKTVPGVPF